MIVLYTDFGVNGPYVGQLKAAILEINPEVTIVDLMHDAPMFDIKHSAFLLGVLYKYFPDDSIYCCVVDPGVGSSRKNIVIQAGNRFFVGPDNALFEYIIRMEDDIRAYTINWKPGNLSNTFHGRDIFGPVSARLAEGDLSDINEISNGNLTRRAWQDELNEIIYIDPYGNLTTGIRQASTNPDMQLKINKVTIKYARTYAEMPDNQPCWYVNSNNLVEVAVSGSNAEQLLSAKVGQIVEIVS